MKRKLLLPLIVLVLATMACSLGKAPAPTVVPPEPTKAPAVQAEEATQPPAPAEPTATEAATEPSVEVATETAAPTETTAGPETFTDSFDRANNKWSDPVIVTTQASGRDPFVKLTSGDGALRFAISDKETYVYKFLNDEISGATTMEAGYQNKGAVNAGMALICQANEDHTSWYEVRLSAADYNYHFYKYDKKLKEEEGKNPYVELAKGHMKVDEYYATKPNQIVFTCTDTELTVDINKGKMKGSYTLDAPLDGKLFGVAALSSDVIPATVDYDTVTVK
jgi:hypothetical protein